MLKAFPRNNDLIEFLSDRQVESGPLTAVVEETDGDDVHLRVAGRSIWLDWTALEIDHISHRDGQLGMSGVLSRRLQKVAIPQS